MHVAALVPVVDLIVEPGCRQSFVMDLQGERRGRDPRCRVRFVFRFRNEDVHLELNALMILVMLVIGAVCSLDERRKYLRL